MGQGTQPESAPGKDMERDMKATLFGTMAVAVAGSALAQPIDSLQVNERIFNDYPDSNLTVTNDFPNSFVFDERDFGTGGFANRHMAFFSQDGGNTAADFDYGDGFDFAVTLNFDATPADGREAGFATDLFGFGFFGVLGNGEIAAFGSFLPFHTFGTVYTNGTDVDLRMIYRPGAGENQLPSSTMEYIIDLGAGPVSSGEIDFDNNEGGIPTNFLAKIGVSVQNQGAAGGSSTATFTNFVVPAPGAGLLALAGVFAGTRRRRA